MAGRPRGITLEARFWEKVDRSGGTDACWPWQAQTSKGHGIFRVNTQRRTQAHRVAYEISVGPIPDGLDMDHMCHNADLECRGGESCAHRRCVNPAHLKPATRRDNVLRGRTIIAAESARTECPSGHPYNDENTYQWRGQRHCKECRRARNRAWQASRRTRKAA